MSGIQRGVSVAITGSVSELNRAMSQAKAAIASARDPVRELSLAFAELDKQKVEMGLTDAQYSAAVAALTVQNDRLRQKNEQLAASFEALAQAKKKVNWDSVDAKIKGMARSSPNINFQAIDEQAADGRSDLNGRLAQFKDERAEAEDRLTAALRRQNEVMQLRQSFADHHDQQMQRGAQYMQQFLTPQQQVKQNFREAYRLYKDGAISVEQFTLAKKKLGEELRKVAFAQTSFGQAVNATKAAITTLLGPLVLAYSAFQAFTASIRMTAELDATRAKFRAFTGSAEEAERILTDLRKISDSQPVSFVGGQKAIATMLQFGVASRDVIQDFRAIAGITGGNQERMENLALSFAQSAAAGKLMGQELLQSVNAGFNPLKVMSEQTGKSMSQLRKEMSDGLISFDMVRQAYQYAIGPMGMYKDLLKEISETTAGKLTQANSRIQELAIAFGELIKPVTDSTLDAFNRTLKLTTDGLKDTVEALKVAAETMRIIRSLSGGGEAPKGKKPQPGDEGPSVWVFSSLGFIAAAADLARAAVNGLNGETKKAIEAWDRFNEWTGGLGNWLLADTEIEKINKWREELNKAEAAAKAAADAEKELEAAHKRVSDAFDEKKKGLRDQLNQDKFGESADALEALRDSMPANAQAAFQQAMNEAQTLADLASFNFNDLVDAGVPYEVVQTMVERYQELVALQAELNRRKDEQLKKDEAQKRILDAIAERDRVLNKADDLNKKHTPGAELGSTLAELDFMLQLGRITADVHKRAVDEAVGKAAGSGNLPDGGLAPAIQKGSQEAYRVMVSGAADKNQQILDQALRQTALQEAQATRDEDRNKLLNQLVEGSVGNAG